MNRHSKNVAQSDFTLRDLYRSLDERKRPEDVARMILAVAGDKLAESVEKALKKISKARSYSYMSQDFQRSAAVLDTQLKVAGTLWAVEAPADAADLEQVQNFLGEIEQRIGKKVGQNDFKADRLNSEARLKAGGEVSRLSRRQYNKRFRLAVRMEDKLERRVREITKRGLTLASKSRLASQITWEMFSSDLRTACFLAYYVARCNLRSLFAVNSQVRPYDEICETMMRGLRASDKTNWLAIAHAMPDEAVVKKLDDRNKGVLLGRYYEMIVKAGRFLEEVWAKSDIDRKTMCVRQGNDSSTWNLMAGAWNKLRDGWFSLCHALGADDIIERQCFGKVMRLMAADVMAWHRSVKGADESNHDDTEVWAKLPLPWEVLFGKATCSQNQVEKTCVESGIDPYEKGWIARRGDKHVEAFSPTPELVHGVVVVSPLMAKAMRKAGIFSGKQKALRLDQSEVDVETLIRETEEARTTHFVGQTMKFAGVA